MSAVTAMHEQMHRAAAQQQQDQKTVADKDVNAVLEAKQQRCDCQRNDQADPDA